ncbi:MAG: 2-dehydropantoate 2-reductase [Elusimicrobiota bacterium]
MNICIIGAGAMGTLFAGLLAKGENNVSLLVKNKNTETVIKTTGIHISGISNCYIQPSKIKVSTIPLKTNLNIHRLVIVLVKSYDTISVLPILKQIVGKDTFVLTLQNGLGNYEIINRVIPKTRIVRGVTSEASILKTTGFAIHTGKGETIIEGCGGVECGDTKIAKEIANIFNHCGLKTKITNSIESAIWSKLVLNCAINPVTAISGVKNGDILKYRNLYEVAIESGKEVMQVAKAVDIPILFSDCCEKIEQVCKATSKNMNSMLADVRANKKTEIEFINGAVIKIAEKLKIPVPVNKSLYSLVKKLEKTN